MSRKEATIAIPRQTPVGLVIRAVRPSDAEQVTEVSNLPGYRHGTLRLPFQSIKSTRKWIKSASETGRDLVAELDGRVVGTAGLNPHNGRRRHVGGVGMGVHDDYNGRGIGTALLAALLDYADNWLGLTRIELTVYTDNVPGIALYKRQGFELEGTLRCWAMRAGQPADVHAMARLRGGGVRPADGGRQQ